MSAKPSESKFTPGPWRLDEYNLFIFGPNGEIIAEVRGEGAGLPLEANGLLLAAAPELYAALEAMVANGCHCRGVNGWHATTCPIPQARAALRRAVQAPAPCGEKGR